MQSPITDPIRRAARAWCDARSVRRLAIASGLNLSVVQRFCGDSDYIPTAKTLDQVATVIGFTAGPTATAKKIPEKSDIPA